jgi:hypothetical protein
MRKKWLIVGAISLLILVGVVVWFVYFSRSKTASPENKAGDILEEGAIMNEIDVEVHGVFSQTIENEQPNSKLQGMDIPANDDGTPVDWFDQEEYDAERARLIAEEQAFAEATSTIEIETSKEIPGIAIGSSDVDKDGLTKDEELQLGTNATNADTDGDRLNDGEEVNQYHTNPLSFDTDKDGLTDGEEILTSMTDPNIADTDGDGFSDGMEVKSGYNPLGQGKL